MDMLEVKRATFRRDLDYMHDRLGVSILWHAEAGGYRLDASDGGARFEKVTCLWLNERKVSPQRVVFYRDNWYLDAFCHLRNEMRSFSIDALESAQETDRPAVSVDDAVLKEELESTYGIFAGKSWRLNIRPLVLNFIDANSAAPRAKDKPRIVAAN